MYSIAEPPHRNTEIDQKIAAAAVVRLGRHGDITRLARHRAVRRQTLYRQAHAVRQALETPTEDPRLASLRQRVAELEGQLAQLQRHGPHAVVIGHDQLAEFAGTAQATGTSLTAARELLQVFLKTRTPSVAKLGRLARQAGRRASALLTMLDEFSAPRIRQVAADEIYSGRRPVLMTVEPHSLCWQGGRLSEQRDAAAWAPQFRALPALEQVTRDGAEGLRKGLAIINQERHERQEATIADQEDHFHLLREAQRALGRVKCQAVRAFRKAEKVQRALDREVWRGVPVVGARYKAAWHWWQKAERAFDRWSAQESCVQRLQAALRLFRPHGELNTRAEAEAEVRAALAGLTGPEWARVRRQLSSPKVFTFLDQVQQQLVQVPAAAGLLPAGFSAGAGVQAPLAEVASSAALGLVHAGVRREGLRRQGEELRGTGPSAAAARGVLLTASVALSLAGESGVKVLSLVRGVLRSACRASSLVEGLNSVVRMEQRRQKRLTQGLLDLKRLHWNVHEFRAGRRKGKSPYQRLGLVLPSGSWWDLLQTPPEQLRQQLSALNTGA